VRPLQQLGHLGAVRPPPDSTIPREVIYSLIDRQKVDSTVLTHLRMS
jgi:hypothetical protein